MALYPDLCGVRAFSVGGCLSENVAGEVVLDFVRFSEFIEM